MKNIRSPLVDSQPIYVIKEAYEILAKKHPATTTKDEVFACDYLLDLLESRMRSSDFVMYIEAVDAKCDVIYNEWYEKNIKSKV